MKLIKLILLLLPLTGFSQVDTSFTISIRDMQSPWIGIDTLPTSLNITSRDLQYYGGANWYTNSSTEIKKGAVESPIQVMDSGIKVDVVETRDTVYNCPYSHISYFTVNGQITKRENYSDCELDKIVTTRRYKLYIINEYGQKEYLSMELTKQK